MLKRIMGKVILLSVIGFMVFTLIQTIFIPPLPTFAQAYDKWGEEFTNGKLSICKCDEKKAECFPCIEIVPIQ